MLLAQAKELSDATQKAIESAQFYGLVGYLLIGVLLAVAVGLGVTARFLAPLIRDAFKSTIDLHTSLKETNLRQTLTLESLTRDHGAKLSDIQEAVTAFHCPMAPGGKKALEV